MTQLRTQTLQNLTAGLFVTVNVNDMIGVRLKTRADVTVDSLELPCQSQRRCQVEKS